MRADPKGYYARLEVDPEASRDAIHAAFRRKARLLHPDIPVTGNAQAFVAVKEAYDVLADPLARAAYDRSARAQAAAPPPAEYDEAEEILPDPPPPIPSVKLRYPRWTDLPLLLWASLGGLVLLAGIEAVLHVNFGGARVNRVAIPAAAPRVEPSTPAPSARPVRLAGSPNAYVLPSGGPAMLWARVAGRDSFVPRGHLPPFSAVQVLHVLRDKGLAEVQLSDNETGFIDASRLTPGNASAARSAYCAYNSGAMPANAEVLQRNAEGSQSLTLINHSGQPTVVKLRTTAGKSAASVYLAPDGDARVDGLPAGPFQIEYAIGELWSRACNSFAAGMRAQRVPGFVDISSMSPATIPPDAPNGPVPVDIPDREFIKP